MQDNLPFIIASILIAGTVCQWLAWLVKLPAIIFLLMTGIAAGPILHLLDPEKLLGDLFFPFISLSVSIILFEGSLTLKLKEIFGLKSVVRKMVSYGMLVTWIITSITAKYAASLSWQISFLFGAILVVTGPTVIVPMLRTVRPNATISNILRWEGIVIDPIGASLAVMVYEFIISGGGQQGFTHTLQAFGQILLVGTVIGVGCGFIFGIVLREHWLPEFLHNITMLALVSGTFTVSNIMQHESGLVTVTVMGIWLANMKDVDTSEILDFKENLSIILISALFIVLAARLDIDSFIHLGWQTVFIFIAVQFLARPLNIMVSAAGSKLTWPERHLLAWIAPRGIVAAAISSLFAIKLEAFGFKDASLIVPLTFSVIIGTVLLQSLTARPIAALLGVAEPDPKGFLIIGANRVGRSIGKALVDNGLRVLVADTDWDKISKARMDGLSTYLGNPMSEHADKNLDLVGIGRMISLSAHESVNIAAVLHYRMELGAENVYMIQSKPEECLSERMRVSKEKKGLTLFGGDISHSYMERSLASGSRIRSTKLTSGFTFSDLMKRPGNRSIPLFAIDAKEKVYIFTKEKKINPAVGWTLIYLYSEAEKLVGPSENMCEAGFRE